MGAVTDIINFLFLFGIIPLISGVYLGKIEVAVALDIGLLLISTVWCFFILRAPWSLYFAARNARIQLSHEKKVLEESDSSFDGHVAELYKWEVYLFIVSLFSPFVGTGGLYVLKLLADAGEIVFLKDVVRPSTVGLIFLCSCIHPAMKAHSALKLKFVSMAAKLPPGFSDEDFRPRGSTSISNAWKKTPIDSGDSKDQLPALQQTVVALQEQVTSFMEEIERLNKVNKLLAQEVKRLRISENTFQADIADLQNKQTSMTEEFEKKNATIDIRQQKKRSWFCTIL